MLAIILADTIQTVFRIFFWLIFARAVLSWVQPAGGSKFISDLQHILYVLTEPIIAPIRNLLPTSGMGIDFSPFIAMILLNLLQGVVVQLIYALFR